jgi:hypothetical protein
MPLLPCKIQGGSDPDNRRPYFFLVGLSLLGGAWVLGAKTAVLANQRIEVPLLLVGVLWFAWFERYLTPYLAQVRHVLGEERLSYPLKSAYEGPSDPAST